MSNSKESELRDYVSELSISDLYGLLELIPQPRRLQLIQELPKGFFAGGRTDEGALLIVKAYEETHP